MGTGAAGRVRRGSIGVLVLVFTGAAIVFYGLSTTSAAIEVLVLAWGVIAWIAFGSRRGRSSRARGPLVRRAVARNLDIDQSGSSPTVRAVVADEMKIRQREDQS